MRQQAIASLNDAFRKRGAVMITPGVQALEDVAGLLAAVTSFDTFTIDNDPYGEHDFGSIQWGGDTVYWKIDYYDQAMQGWCDPLSPECHRVMTVLLASEY